VPANCASANRGTARLPSTQSVTKWTNRSRRPDAMRVGKSRVQRNELSGAGCGVQAGRTSATAFHFRHVRWKVEAFVQLVACKEQHRG